MPKNLQMVELSIPWWANHCENLWPCHRFVFRDRSSQHCPCHSFCPAEWFLAPKFMEYWNTQSSDTGSPSSIPWRTKNLGWIGRREDDFRSWLLITGKYAAWSVKIWKRVFPYRQLNRSDHACFGEQFWYSKLFLPVLPFIKIRGFPYITVSFGINSCFRSDILFYKHFRSKKKKWRNTGNQRISKGIKTSVQYIRSS